ncbi:MAG: hypothetical protein AAFR14_12000 [Bacteroidota bacterium]
MNYLHTVISTLLLWLLGLLAVSIIKGITIDEELSSSALFIAELAEDIAPQDRITAESLLSDHPMVKANSVSYIPREEASEVMVHDFPGLENIEKDVFRDIITFRTDGVSDIERTNLRQQVLEITGVSGFYYEEDLFSGVGKGLARFRIGLLVLSAVLMAAVIMVIAYSLRQSIADARSSIIAMHLAGSTADYIKKPFLRSSLQRALRCGLTACILLVINIILINQMILRGFEISILQSGMACLCVIIIAMVMYYFTTDRATKTYLNEYQNPI